MLMIGVKYIYENREESFASLAIRFVLAEFSFGSRLKEQLEAFLSSNRCFYYDHAKQAPGTF